MTKKIKKTNDNGASNVITRSKRALKDVQENQNNQGINYIQKFYIPTFYYSWLFFTQSF
jgi:hypothetical protein